MNCLTPPQDLAEFFGVITCAAAAYGGPGWVSTALMGVVAAASLLILLCGLVAAVRYTRNG